MASNDETTAFLQEKWEHLTKATNVNKSVQDKWWDHLKSHYLDPKRKYHTFVHLKRMFDDMEDVKDLIQSKEAMSYAIFFHDASYDVHAQDNEENSFNTFTEFITEADTEEVISLGPLVEQLIKASKASCAEVYKSDEMFGKEDMHFFMDFDISILGYDPKEYKKFSDQIREEYSFLPKSRYNGLRIKVLQQFLQIPNIYATEIFHKKYEKQARCNIQNEIDALQKE
ncbi:hypothetical protein JTE90_007245 [Oedothorax gibbosus]|uniref:Metal-dependent HD superfamily phosphohydrolase n=1 Tax=Oedothorax gibbosus TaxID=931172 RepID=A0AAV6VNV5_9ARAC|nr:hypothetical protein JTE90_007245 [Oedothorax gibbosus]